MRRRLVPLACLASALLPLSAGHAAAPGSHKEAQPRDAELGKKADLGKKEETKVPERDLAGDITRRKTAKQKDRPALEYDQYRLGVELQVASKRREQIETLQKIIQLGPAAHEAPSLLFRLAELYWEESKFYFFEANRKDDEILTARHEKNEARAAQAEAEKKAALKKSDSFQALAIDQYRTIVRTYPTYDRMDEVLFFLGHNMWDSGKEKEAVVVYQKLIKDHLKSRYLPDAWVAVGQYYFNASSGRREFLEEALDAFKKAATFTESKVYGYALYMQGWAQFNLGDFRSAMDMFRAVIYYGELQGKADTRSTALSKEARKDYVVAYSRIGDAMAAKGDFQKVGGDENWWGMLKGLANLYYEDGKDKEATLVYNTLIREKPLSPEAPFFQGRIVDCVMRVGIKKVTVAQVRELVRIIKDVGAAGVITREEDKKSFAEARDLAERTMSNLAVNWHNEAKKTRDEATFLLAAEVYQDYLEIFADNPKAYDLRFYFAELLNDNLGRFDRAAEEYSRVVQQDIARMEPGEGKQPEKPGRWLVNAAYNAILAYDEVAKRLDRDQPAARGDGKSPMPLPPAKAALLAACDRYIKYVPDGEKRVEVMYKAGYLLYLHNHFDRALALLTKIALEHPEHELAEVSANLVLDSYNLQGDWAGMNQWARRFHGEPRLARGKLKEQLAKVVEQSAFKLVNIAEEKGDYVGAAEAYLGFVNEFPRSEIADLALFNASVDFFKGKQVDRSIDVRRQLIERYPKSRYLPQCVFANGESYETIGEFELAAESYEAYAAAWAEQAGPAKASKGKPAKGGKGARATAARASEPETDRAPAPEGGFEERKAKLALFNAGVFREGLGHFREALRDRQRYVELWPDGKDTPAVFLSIADLYEKSGQPAKALAQLDDYEKDWAREPDKMLAAELRIARIHEKRGDARAAQRIYARALEYFEKLPRAQREKLGQGAVEAVAKAAYLAVEPQFEAYAKQRFPSDERRLKATLEAKQKALVEVQKRYTDVVNLKAADPAICSLYKIGLLYKDFSDALTEAPIPEMPLPKQLNPIKHLMTVPWKRWPKDYKQAISEADFANILKQLEEAKVQFEQAYRDQLMQLSAPLDDKAAEAFATAVQKSRELAIYNSCSDKALELLGAKYKPDQFPKVTERLAQPKAPPAAREGNGLLTGVQPIPVAAPGAAAGNASGPRTAAEPGPDVSRIVPASGTAPARPAATAAPARGSKASGPATEPEDPDLIR